ncbi:hypothetical protein N7931_16455 [Catenovulum sp. 2E275]|uniref:hypothetical protein n=1 Tax=Catenovulum sp. 2E275 TaxID=2980497 RepID=UPI0021D17242|nr:hypothetical protein [Catenovulum sp. 2E275]MCU4677222.1 hypothetical protein [Catenovulum sp. 2E275]
MSMLHLYWPFEFKKGYFVQAKDALNHSHYAIIDSVLNDNYSQSYYLLIDPQTYVELGWFKKSQLKRRVINFSAKLSHAGM